MVEGQQEVTVPLVAQSSGINDSVLSPGNIAISVSRAELAYGPLYICAGYNAGDHCDIARLEWLDTAVLNLKNPNPITLGQLQGVSGTVRSWMYDMGISSLLTQKKPEELKAARSLGGHSMVLEGSAIQNGVQKPFIAKIRVAQTEKTEFGLPVVRKRSDEVFEHTVDERPSSLRLQLNPNAWVSSLDLQPYFAEQNCDTQPQVPDPKPPPLLCQGQNQVRCSAEGQELERIDCATQSMVCQPGRGCVRAIEIAADSKAYRTLLYSLVIDQRPQLRWDPLAQNPVAASNLSSIATTATTP